MLFILIFLLMTIVFIWTGQRRQALFFFAIGFALAIVWFYHHLDTSLTLQL